MPLSTSEFPRSVLIVGGGPAGSTAAAMVKKHLPDAQVAIVEAANFPREHIGESMGHPLIPVLEQSGALAAVLESDCYIEKYGGTFHWNPNNSPFISMFEHAQWEEDKSLRWSIHVNRAEFDTILIEHAASLGAYVRQGVSVARAIRENGQWLADLSDGSSIRADILLDASGRNASYMVQRGKREWLSNYKNIAVWNHFQHCVPIQDLDEEWNIFNQLEVSAVGCYAFEGGWVWYIPIPSTVEGVRQVVHSVGIVTNPEYIKKVDLGDVETFMQVISTIPGIGQLTAGAQPIHDMLTTTNYSRISEEFCSYEDRWISIGDASFFVDPLFSSGVSFAASQAIAAALLVAETFKSERVGVDNNIRDLWRDYDEGWRALAQTTGLAIDQWYHEIARNFENGVYWSERPTSRKTSLLPSSTFRSLLNTAFITDLLHVMTEGSGDENDLDTKGPYQAAVVAALDGLCTAETRVRISDEVNIRPGWGLDVPGLKGVYPPPQYPIADDVRKALANYWESPELYADAVPTPLRRAVRCLRFEKIIDGELVSERALERDQPSELVELLKDAPTLDELQSRINPAQLLLLRRLIYSKIVIEVKKPDTIMDAEDECVALAHEG